MPSAVWVLQVWAMTAAADTQSCQMQLASTAIMHAIAVWALQQLQLQLQLQGCTILISYDRLSTHQHKLCAYCSEAHWSWSPIHG